MSPQSPGTDPLAPLADLPGVAEAVETARAAVDALHRHRVMRRRRTEVAAEAALRGARASAALAGADWGLEEVRRRTDFGTDAQARTVGAALRATAEAAHLRDIWKTSPLRVLARLHLVAEGGVPAGAGTGAEVAGAAPGAVDAGEGVGTASDGGIGVERIGRPRLPGESVTDGGRDAGDLPLPDATETAARLAALRDLITGGSSAPVLVQAAVVHGELSALRPFGSRNGIVARAACRIVLTGGGLDPGAVAPAEVGFAEQGPDAHHAALAEYASGTADGVARWIIHCGRAVELGARESVAVCEALQRGAA
ncbi:oxidoreductase [Streptomyces calidiresistens]|uniref:Oxidoreductase n=1 Tax=Streptomyces calidiresistens TaxID=1485586 RepID=A0A7W3T6Y9_9ACTN|nr:Fic family protein [Streptomyces calidiresistens]MBB0232084.1 oxidoreductase [Streptomyces calidiresistens]